MRYITAIMGGTFDPVHLGHMSFAMDVLDQTEVEKVVFMPAKLQPFKLDVKMSSYEDRAAMLGIACDVINSKGCQAPLAEANYQGPLAEVSLLESELPGVSYTYRTLEEYAKRYLKGVRPRKGELTNLKGVRPRKGELTGDEGEKAHIIDEVPMLYFITGADSFVKLDTWMEHEKLLSDNAFIVGVRPGYPDEEIYEKKAEYEEKFGTHSLIIKNTPVDMSATEVRRAVSEGRNIDGMVTPGVAEYIRQHRLYR